MEAQGLLDRRLEEGHGPQGLVADLGAVGVELGQLLVDPGHDVGVAEHSIRVQAAVPDVVWCPANIIEMNMPVTSSA